MQIMRFSFTKHFSENVAITIEQLHEMLFYSAKTLMPCQVCLSVVKQIFAFIGLLFKINHTFCLIE